MLIYCALFGGVGTILIYSSCKLKKVFGYCLISYCMSFVILLSNPAGTQLTQGLILTSIVISLGLSVIMLHRK